MAQFDITKTNAAVERELEKTKNPWHRFLLMTYNRHRYLEMAGRYEEIFVPDMTVENPVYRFGLIGLPAFRLDGRDQVVSMYRNWADSSQSIFYAENETLAVGDNMIVTRSLLYQQQLGSDLQLRGIDVDGDAMYLMRANIAMIWPYDDRGRMIGEDVWEYDDADREFVKLDPADVLSTKQAAELLEPFIKPLPPLPAVGLSDDLPGAHSRTFSIEHSAKGGAVNDQNDALIELGVEAYTYLYPALTMDLTRRQAITTGSTVLTAGPMNTFVHIREFPPADFKGVVRPSFDTLYSLAWLDLTSGPVVVSSAAVTDGRYYELPMYDMWTDEFAVPGSRTTGTDSGNWAITPRGWPGEIPPGVDRIESPTPYVWIIGRTETHGPSDYSTVHAIQDGYSIIPLANWGGDAAAGALGHR